MTSVVETTTMLIKTSYNDFTYNTNKSDVTHILIYCYKISSDLIISNVTCIKYEEVLKICKWQIHIKFDKEIFIIAQGALQSLQIIIKKD